MNGFYTIFRNLPGGVQAITRNFGWMVASRGLAAVFSLVYLAIITRSLGISGFGKFALITGSAQFLASLLAFQTWQIVVQFGVAHVDNGDETRLARLFRSAVVLDAISAIVGIAASAVVLHFFAESLGMTPTLARATLIFNAIMLISFRSTPIGILRLRDRFDYAAAADSAVPTFRLIGAVLVALIHPKLQGFLIAWAIAELLTATAYWFAVHKAGDLRPILGRGVGLRGVVSENPGIVRFALTSNFSQSLYMSVKQVPLLLVGGLTGTAAAGAFRLAAQLSRALATVSQMIAKAAFPEIVRAVRSQGVVGLGTIIARSLRVTVAVGAIVFVLVILLGRVLLETVGGAEFGIAYISLLWLSAAACIDLAIVAFEPSILAAQRAHFLFLARLAATSLMIGGALMLQPIMGAEGVAAAVFINSVGQALLLSLIIMLMTRSRTPAAPPA